MKNSKNIFRAISAMALFLFIAATTFAAPKGKQMLFEVKIYRIKSAAQETVIDAYLKDAYLPALHRAGIPTVGVCKPIETDTAFGKMVYVFIPYKNMEQYSQLSVKLAADQVYAQAGKAFLDAPYNDPPFVRYESILAQAFSNMPVAKYPSFTTPKSDRIYEYRSYESATEAKAAKKIHMFNDGGEMGIFENIGANAVFYAKVILGSQMPRLIYMTTYADMKSHDACWAAFRAHPEWKRISALEEYKNSTSKTRAFLLHPTDYSDF